MIIEKRVPLSYLIGKIKMDVIYVVTFSLVTQFTNILSISIEFPIAIPTLLGTAISLLLSFKLAQSYDRWWEARKIWGAIVNDSRTMVLQLNNFCNNKDENTLQWMVKKIAYRQIAWCYALSASLRKLNPFEPINKLISKEEMKDVKLHMNVPLALIDLNLKDLNSLHKQNHLNTFEYLQLDNTFIRLCASMGKAERIKNTVFPKTYRLFLHLFIYIFLTTLAMAIVSITGILQVFIMLIICIPFFLLEKTAFYMQDPFENQPTDTATDDISEKIEINIKQLLKEKNIPNPKKPNTFYVM